MGDKKTRSKSKNDPSKIVEITPNYVNGPVKKLFVDMLSDMKASKKWIKTISGWRRLLKTQGPFIVPKEK